MPERALLDRLDGLAAVPGLAAGESMLALTAPRSTSPWRNCCCR
ncbi:hypothetical protein NKH77_44555 [Streptomyces sp. M19]